MTLRKRDDSSGKLKKSSNGNSATTKSKKVVDEHAKLEANVELMCGELKERLDSRQPDSL